MRASVWQVLAAHGVIRDDPATWSAGGGLPLVELAGALRPGPVSEATPWSVGRAAAFASVPAALAAVVDAVLGVGCWAPVAHQHGGLAAPNLPIRHARWNVPDVAWHLDEPTAAGSARRLR